MTEPLPIDVQFPGLTESTQTTGPSTEAPAPAPETFEVIRLNDILATSDIVRKKEADDAQLFAQLATPNMGDLRNRVIAWGVGGFNGTCLLMEFRVTPPPLCSDGVARTLWDYIQFVSGKTIADHMAILNQRVPDFRVVYLHTNGLFQFFAIKG